MAERIFTPFVREIRKRAKKGEKPQSIQLDIQARIKRPVSLSSIYSIINGTMYPDIPGAVKVKQRKKKVKLGDEKVREIQRIYDRKMQLSRSTDDRKVIESVAQFYGIPRKLAIDVCRRYAPGYQPPRGLPVVHKQPQRKPLTKEECKLVVGLLREGKMSDVAIGKLVNRSGPYINQVRHGSRQLKHPFGWTPTPIWKKPRARP